MSIFAPRYCSWENFEITGYVLPSIPTSINEIKNQDSICSFATTFFKNIIKETVKIALTITVVVPLGAVVIDTLWYSAIKIYNWLFNSNNIDHNFTIIKKDPNESDLIPVAAANIDEEIAPLPETPENELKEEQFIQVKKSKKKKTEKKKEPPEIDIKISKLTPQQESRIISILDSMTSYQIFNPINLVAMKTTWVEIEQSLTFLQQGNIATKENSINSFLDFFAYIITHGDRKKQYDTIYGYSNSFSYREYFFKKLIQILNGTSLSKEIIDEFLTKINQESNNELRMFLTERIENGDKKDWNDFFKMINDIPAFDLSSLDGVVRIIE